MPDPHAETGRGPDYPDSDEESRVATQERDDVDDAVEKLLDEVEGEPEPRPLRLGSDLRGTSAIVTGASTGIGRAIALALARCGVDLAFNYLADDEEAEADAAKTSRELRELEVRVFCRACDVRETGDVNAFVDEAVGRLGGIRILVNNAGISRDGAFWRLTDQAWRDVIETNLTGTFNFTRAVAPHFRAQEDGKIVNVSSVHGFRSEFGISSYAASKAAIISFTRSCAVELGRYNVNVNAVAPGYIRTTRLTEMVPAEILDRAREESALGRLGDPQDVASVVVFLCSEGARHITGAVIPIDGGYRL